MTIKRCDLRYFERSFEMYMIACMNIRSLNFDAYRLIFERNLIDMNCEL